MRADLAGSVEHVGSVRPGGRERDDATRIAPPATQARDAVSPLRRRLSLSALSALGSWQARGENNENKAAVCAGSRGCKEELHTSIGIYGCVI